MRGLYVRVDTFGLKREGNKYMSIYHKVIGEGYPIVMLHGWTLDHQVMLHAMEPLFEKRSGMKRIYIELPGMGAFGVTTIYSKL